MIQGQFDAATKVDITRPQNNTSDVMRDHAERPRKRRKTSPPPEDSINVVDIASDHPPGSPDFQGSVEPKKPGDVAGTEPVEVEEEDAYRQSLPAASTYDACLSSIMVRTSTSTSDTEAPGPSQDSRSLESEQEENVQVASETASEAASSSTSPRPYSLATGSVSRNNKTSERPFRPANNLKHSHPLFPGENAASGPSTPKGSLSGAHTYATSSPLSSPPPELFDPYDEQSTGPVPSSSRPSSPVSDDEGRSNSSDEGDSALFQGRVNRSRTLRRSLSTLKGRELFDASIWADPLKTSVFYTFATNLRQKSKDAVPTGCHEFISHLSNAGKMVRCYTQNIDLLEDKVGLSTRLLLGPGSRSRFSTRLSKGAVGTATPRNLHPHRSPPSIDTDTSCIPSQTQTPSEQGVKEEGKLPTPAASFEECRESPSQHMAMDESNHEVIENNGGPSGHAFQNEGDQRTVDSTTTDMLPASAVPTNLQQHIAKPDSSQHKPEHDRGVECVFLHGSLRSLRCFQCGCVADWDEGDREHLTLSGEQPPCPRCEDATAARQERGKRALGVGKLRPDIVLYGEEHPESQRISTIIQHDISLAPDMLIVMGTSLKVHGLKTVVREFAKAVHNKKDGKVIFINYTKPAESVWADVIDFWVEMDCDAWVQDLKEKKPIIWLPPGSVDDEPRNTKRRRTIKVEADKRQSKKTKNVEEVKDMAQLAHTPDTERKKKEMPKSMVKEEVSDTKKSKPLRPAYSRDCKHNAAYWTVRIMSELAKLSGRKEVRTSMPLPPEPTPTPQHSIPTSATDAFGAENAEPLKRTVNVRRGPRTKNTKSRKMLGDPRAMPKARKKPTGGVAKFNGLEAAQFPMPAASIQPESDEALASGQSTSPAVIICASTAGDLGPDKASDATILAEVPIPNLGTGTEQSGPGTSILASVKSNPRIRKPKKIFGEPALGTTSTPSNNNSKSRAKTSTRQGRETNSNAKPQKGKGTPSVEADDKSAISPGGSIRILPALPPRLQPISAVSALQSSQREETPVEAYYNLPPLGQANVEGQPEKHGLAANGIMSNSGASTGLPLPDVLEPIIVPGPPVAISPTTLSPHHWRNRAFSFTYGNSLLSHFEYYPQGRPRQIADDASIHSGMPSHQRQRADTFHGICPSPALDGQYTVSELLPPGVDAVGIEDSPSQQLHRESRETEAAAALNDLRQQAKYDSRQFAVKPAGL